MVASLPHPMAAWDSRAVALRPDPVGALDSTDVFHRRSLAAGSNSTGASRRLTASDSRAAFHRRLMASGSTAVALRLRLAVDSGSMNVLAHRRATVPRAAWDAIPYEDLAVVCSFPRLRDPARAAADAGVSSPRVADAPSTTGDLPASLADVPQGAPARPASPGRAFRDPRERCRGTAARGSAFASHRAGS